MSKSGSEDMQEYFEVVQAIGVGSLNILLEKKPGLIKKFFFGGMTVAHLVATSGTSDDIKYLAGKNANFNVVNDDGMTPLALTVASGDLSKAEVFLDNGAQISVSGEGRPILIEAAFSGKDEIIDLLLKRKASMEVGNQIVDQNNPHAKAILKVVSSIEEASKKQDQNSFISYIKGERGRLGDDDITKMVVEGIDSEQKRQEVLKKIDASGQVDKETTKAALVFCWSEIDAVKNTKAVSVVISAEQSKGEDHSSVVISHEQSKGEDRSKFYKMATKVYRAISMAASKIARCFKKKAPNSVEIADAVSAICATESKRVRVPEEKAVSIKPSVIATQARGSRGGPATL